MGDGRRGWYVGGVCGVWEERVVCGRIGWCVGGREVCGRKGGVWEEREVCGVGEEGGMCDKRKVCGWIGRCVEGERGVWGGRRGWYV